MASSSVLSERFEAALIYASQLHANQRRKGTTIPYISHLLGVASLVIEDGGDEDEVIAALLHDAPEDQGGLSTLDEIRVRFGERVAAIVEGCTDTFNTPKPAWRKRKEDYLLHLAGASLQVVRVSLADKLHNARAILRDVRRDGAHTFTRFNGGKGGTLWYYSALAQVYRSRCPEADMLSELEQVIDQIKAFAGESSGRA